MRAGKALASLHICTDLSEPSLLTDAISTKILCIVPYLDCLFTGAKVRQEIYEAFENIYPILKGFKKQ